MFDASSRVTHLCFPLSTHVPSSRSQSSRVLGHKSAECCYAGQRSLRSKMPLPQDLPRISIPQDGLNKWMQQSLDLRLQVSAKTSRYFGNSPKRNSVGLAGPPRVLRLRSGQIHGAGYPLVLRYLLRKARWQIDSIVFVAQLGLVPFSSSTGSGGND
jgi:hypothetical protein